MSETIPAPNPTPATKRTVASWAIWDWATQPFNSVILTFVWVSLYLVSDAFLPDEIAAQNADGSLVCSQTADAGTAYCTGLADLSANYGWVTFAAGILILLLAPVLGQQADARGSKKRWVVLGTAALALIQFAMFFVYSDPQFFWFGAAAVALGAVASEIAGVSYNAMLFDVSTKKTVGRVSGLGWGLGYIGGIVALIIVVVLTELDWFGMDVSDGLAYRLIAVGAAVWTIVFSIPFLLWVPEPPARTDRPRVGFFRSYAVLVRDLGALFRNHRQTFWFLISSAVYRDGLAGIFAFGGILAAVSFGFSATEVMIFGVALNLVAGVSTIIAGRLDDRFGPRAIIVTSLLVLVVSGLFIFFFREEGKSIFWIGGLILSAAVGPAQASSRSLLTHMTPASMQGEVFGLYATTGRVMSFLSPWLWAAFIGWFGATHFGILGLIIVVALGLALTLVFVRKPEITDHA
ncbi:MFS transporter [Leucobacter aridicollis]|uniref:UMF1 family MFS transporter n=1 Tax=Leucobacter aridicollis TaxID=283878 RepID=A0A852R4B2_9MICO|nr:MFS transporter [Leucobacter aridicollis]MBL3683083.1 MFS transporter [Leucobacter aridicollis]NYD25309.1 UMF1 family MFS transporter [Leucobacter aridicollis]